VSDDANMRARASRAMVDVSRECVTSRRFYVTRRGVARFAAAAFDYDYVPNETLTPSPPRYN